ncbi:MAG: methylated-DNA--[protein]-cysteine S-methyltransferase [Syntrophobacterales bacterium]|nr:methylated-DNA--[protein]-cysteine S-methyltransferase [Syntrophobacterales bacterium]
MSDQKTVVIQTPFGSLEVLFIEKAILRVRWIKEELVNQYYTHSEEPIALQIQQEFLEYFRGLRRTFTLPYTFLYVTPFCLRVWEEIRKISYGETITYSELARRVGKETSAARAIGRACALNPLPIIIPCHRVIRKDGFIGHYSAPGGAELKIGLIAFEQRVLRGDLPIASQVFR